MKTTFKSFVQGYLVGVANIIPGVSGGTLALVLGIYPRLLAALSNLDAAALGTLLRALALRPGWRTDIVRTLRRVDAGFLALLGAGALAGVVSLSRLMTYLLLNYLTLTYAFFFGLIMASMVFPYRALRRRGLVEAGACLAAAALTVALTVRVDHQPAMDRAIEKIAAENRQEAGQVASDSQPAGGAGGIMGFQVRLPDAAVGVRVFGGAALAIAAMVLPGVSGSFVLLLLGVYFDLLRAVDQRDLALMAVFMVGGLFGLLVLARVVNFCLRRFFNVTMAAMAGLMLGSLWALWPFKRYVVIGEDMFLLGNLSPGQWPGHEILTATAVCAAGAALVALFLILEKSKPES